MGTVDHVNPKVSIEVMSWFMPVFFFVCYLHCISAAHGEETSVHKR